MLCHYDEKGQGQVYRRQNCACWFPSVERYTQWIQRLALPGKFYAFPLRNLADQLAYLKIFRNDGLSGVLYDPQESDADGIPLDDLAATLEEELRRS